MSDADPARAFRDLLPPWIRAQLHDTQAVTALVHAAIRHGWTLEELATECTRDTQGIRNAGGLVMYRLRSRAQHTQARSTHTTLPWCTDDCRARGGLIEHPDTGLPIGRCPCRTPQPREGAPA